MISGKVVSSDKEVVDFATVYLKGTNYGSSTNEKGIYHLYAPAGEYTLVVSAIGYTTVEKNIELKSGERMKENVTIAPQITELDEVTVTTSGVSRVNKSAFNAVAIDAKNLHNSTQSLSDALTKVPGLKLREAGGVGSDIVLSLDGFTGKHIKLFIDGVPQEGVGSSFGLNNIPINFADRIEVYRGVVPVGFGTDALGGVINIVTNKSRRSWFLDASYSYASFNTHKSYVNFGKTLKNGFTYEINAFQNYSDNSYYVNTPVEEFYEGGGSSINTDKIERVKRFHDNYHNEAVIGKVGFVDKKWADRFMIGVAYSRMYKEIQTGVVQKVVFGEKYRKGNSLMPSLEYRKRNVFVKNLDVALTLNYNRNFTNNVDTATYRYNWRGEKISQKGRKGEQSYQDIRSNNDNWNTTFTANYHIGTIHTFTLNHVMNAFHRENKNSVTVDESNTIAKQTRKNITGLSYRLMPSEHWNLSVFGKSYNQFNAGPVSASTSGTDNYVRLKNTVSSMGYGVAGTYFILSGLQAKLSYEKAYRLPTNEELFGDEDLELGKIGLKPEKSDNLNLNLSYNQQFGKHGLYVEGGLIYRNTSDYIYRSIETTSNRSYGSYSNYGSVETKGYNISARYSYSHWVSVGGNFTQMDVRDHVKTTQTGQESLTYGARMPNLPYRFANSDVSFYWRNLWKKGNTLIVTYDNLYVYSFPLYSEVLGAVETKEIVPTQFSHNLAITYSLKKGRYNVSFECKNFTNERLYDNFSLQKAGRAFYGKVRVYFGGR
ncbi:TonB-dependent receptor [Bacteroides sp.]|uniref:TonB-dependent receptor n=1 Tax=Bacteroides sp. TaxID=29523 RepID=UPI00261B6267|nr:TonB-dependent receptor [Bacteroides sp.]MDD3038439.1 TonB-dependent receptor [Bacteroides sp.]